MPDGAGSGTGLLDAGGAAGAPGAPMPELPLADCPGTTGAGAPIPELPLVDCPGTTGAGAAGEAGAVPTGAGAD